MPDFFLSDTGTFYSTVVTKRMVVGRKRLYKMILERDCSYEKNGLRRKHLYKNDYGKRFQLRQE
jgi:hypothetical protein